MIAITSVSALSAFFTQPSDEDPYIYQTGFGNSFVSEALAGAVPHAQNQPQKNKYDLYIEGVTGSAFVAPRDENMSAFLYRIFPSVAHLGFTRLPDNPDLESSFFPSNPKVHISPTQLSWQPFDLPSDSTKIDFIEGLKTLCGGGDSTLREGVAIHIYVANASMEKRAFCNSDGDILIIPQLGRLDIQTEFGKMMVRPGEICVIQRGLKFKVVLPDGPSRGYIQEIFGSHYKLPELGPVGSHGLANIRDFESPVACFDIDESEWQIVYKICAELHACKQNHTPFDVVGWTGRYVPYKYNLEKFVHVGSITKDHLDPSIFCVLTAPSKQVNVSLTDFLTVKERWDVAENTFRPPWYHRNSATEFMGIVYGDLGHGRSELLPGGANFGTNFAPHGVDHDVYKMATEANLRPMIIHKGAVVFVMESSITFTMTDYAMHKSGKLRTHDPEIWSAFKPHFMSHIPEINAAREAVGLPKLSIEKN